MGKHGSLNQSVLLRCGFVQKILAHVETISLYLNPKPAYTCQTRIQIFLSQNTHYLRIGGDISGGGETYLITAKVRLCLTAHARTSISYMHVLILLE